MYRKAFMAVSTLRAVPGNDEMVEELVDNGHRENSLYLEGKPVC